MSDSLREYYAARAPAYDAVYTKPERQQDLRAIERWLPTTSRDASPLEIRRTQQHTDRGDGCRRQHLPAAGAAGRLDAPRPEELPVRTGTVRGESLQRALARLAA